MFDGTSSCCWRSLALFYCNWFPIFHRIPQLHLLALAVLFALTTGFQSISSNSLKKGRPFCLQKGGDLFCPSHDSKSDGEEVFMKGNIYEGEDVDVFMKGKIYL